MPDASKVISVAGLLALAWLGGCHASPVATDRDDRLEVLDNTRWVFEDQADLFSDASRRRGAEQWGWFFSPDRANWDVFGDQISETGKRWERLGEAWPSRNQPAGDIDRADQPD
ncbi:MAG: hypothetical protein GC200_07760 [Tepidisphaera sp.]|nr:hypothetical protein [Tepidisphaera sp.]